MKIYDAKKIEIADVPVTKNAKHEQELMKSDYIRLESGRVYAIACRRIH